MIKHGASHLLVVAACEALWCGAALGGGAGVCTGAGMQPGASGLGGDETAVNPDTAAMDNIQCCRYN